MSLVTAAGTLGVKKILGKNLLKKRHLRDEAHSLHCMSHSQSRLEMGLCLSKISFGSKISYLKRPCQEECLMPDLHACALLTWTALGGQMRETLVLQNLHSCGKDIYHLWHKTKLISYIALRNAFWKQLLSEVYIHIPVSTTC